MRKILSFVAVMLVCGLSSAQTFVSTEVANKNAIIEEYTGVNCGNCPDGHKIANQIVAANPGRVWAINIHQGSFAANTYTTQWGNALAAQTNLSGYPSGTVNRHVFSGSATALNRGQWASATNTILGQPSPVNVAARGTLDFATRVLSLEVEVYYTSNSAVPTNMLNVAVLQDNILGPQAGAAANPAQVEGSQYRHMHMLRDLITGQWGDTIPTTTQGTFFSRTYTYTVPQSLSNEEMVLEDLNVIVFVAEGRQEILTGCHADVQFIGAQPKIMSLEVESSFDCDINFEASFKLKNLGEAAITSAEFSYEVDNTTNTYTWTGNVAPMASVDIALPALTNLAANTDYDIDVTLTKVNGEDIDGNTLSTTFSKEVYDVTGPFEFVLATDKYASETSYKFLRPNGSVFNQSSPFQDGSTVVVHNYTLNPPMGCYILEVYDAYGDGINGGYGAGYFLIRNAEGEQVFRNNGKFGAMARYFLNVTTDGDGSVGIDEVNDQVKIYPNPVTDNLNIAYNGEVRNVEIFDLVGRKIYQEEGNVHQVSTATLVSGVYVVRVVTENGTVMQKIVKE